jgi:anti-sigma28 factor (negative regulator of flagellin synthesis)
MRIDSNRTPVTRGEEKSGTGAPASPLEKEVVADSDHTELSPLARALTSHDTDPIELLRQQVQSGSYDVSAETIANALIDVHLGK